MGKPSNKGDEYTSKHSVSVSRDNSNDGNDRERKQYNDGVEPTTPNKEHLSSSTTLTDTTYLNYSPENEAKPSSEPLGDTPPDATAITVDETTPDDAK